MNIFLTVLCITIVMDILVNLNDYRRTMKRRSSLLHRQKLISRNKFLTLRGQGFSMREDINTLQLCVFTVKNLLQTVMKEIRTSLQASAIMKKLFPIVYVHYLKSKMDLRDGKLLIRNKKEASRNIEADYFDVETDIWAGDIVFGDGKIVFGDGKIVFGDGKIVFGDGKIVFGDGKNDFGDGKNDFRDGKNDFRDVENDFSDVENDFSMVGDDFCIGKFVYWNRDSDFSAVGNGFQR